MKVNKAYKKLINKIYAPFIFYVPSSIIPEENKALFNHPEVKILLDKIWVVGNDLKFLDLQSNPKLLDLITRSGKLDNNIIKLIELKDKLSTLEFNFILDNYYSQINFYLRISNWLHDNIKTEIKDVSNSIVGYFLIQMRLFDNHFKKFNDLFCNQTKPINQNIDVISHVKENIPSLNDFLKKPANNTNSNNNIVKEKTTRKKPVLITDEDARAYLLETVFNVKS